MKKSVVLQGCGRPGVPGDCRECLEVYGNPAQHRAGPEKEAEFTNSRGDVVHRQHDGNGPGRCQGGEASRNAVDVCGRRRLQLSVADFHERSAVPLGATECITTVWETAGAVERR